MYGVRLRHYPNNELRLTAFPVSGGRFSFEDDENENHSQPSVVELPPPPSPVCEDDLPPLSLPPNSELFEPPGFGGLPRPSKFTLNGRRQILRSAGAMDKSGIQQGNCLFLTGTLPGSTSESMEAIARWSGYIVDRLKSWASKYVKNRSEFYCWELQKRGALHLHWCIGLGDFDSGESLLKGFHRQWRKLLLKVCSRAGVDLFARSEGGTWMHDESKPRTDAQRCEKSVAAYMAKYCSKGSTPSEVPVYCPSRWWGVSRPLLAVTRSLTSEKEMIFSNCNSARKAISNFTEFLDSECDVVHSYSSQCGLFEVKVGYHPPQRFADIGLEVKGKDPVDVFELSDGSKVETKMGLRQKLQFIHDICPSSPSLDIIKMSIAGKLNTIARCVSEPDVEFFISMLEQLSFLDTGLSHHTLKCSATQAELVRVSRFAWRVSRELADIHRRCYANIVEEETFQAELSSAQRVYEQQTLFEITPIAPIPWHD